MSPRERSGPLNRDGVVDTALAIIDRLGVDGLSIRGLAQELDRAPMTLYSHFASRNDLLDRAFVRLAGRLASFPRHARSTWREELEGIGRHIRRVLKQHPHWIALLTRVSPPADALGAYDRLLRLMREDGFGPAAAMYAFSAVLSHALGSVLVERMLDARPHIPRQRLKLVKDLVAGMPRGAYPGIAAASGEFDSWNFDDTFEIGLHSLVAGLDGTGPGHARFRRSRARRHA